MQKSLQSSEWILVSSLLILLASLVIITRFHEHRKAAQLKLLAQTVEKPISISIEGAVSKPGIYSVPPGTRLGDVLKKSRPKRFANLRPIDLEQPVEADIALQISELTCIRVRVAGAISNPVELEVPAGTRLSDLKSKIQCTPLADGDFLKSRRLLKDGEVVEVPVAAEKKVAL